MQFKDQYPFPDLSHADEDGLLAMGGDLNPIRLLSAYESGIFPWFSEGQPILWWSPDPRFVLFPNEVKVTKSMRQFIRNSGLRCTLDQNFEGVIDSCSKIPRKDQDGTWITEDMLDAYVELHKMGYAHSVEIWKGDALVGGLYGVSMGKCFFGESMFSKESNSSKMAFILFVEALHKRNFDLIDCQVHTSHLESLGARMIPRKTFIGLIEKGISKDEVIGSWSDFL